MLQVLSVPSSFISMFASFYIDVSEVLKWIIYLISTVLTGNWFCKLFFWKGGGGCFKTTTGEPRRKLLHLHFITIPCRLHIHPNYCGRKLDRRGAKKNTKHSTQP